MSDGTAAWSSYRLDNGLTVILHRDTTAPLITINVLYHVGSRDERRGRTGLAHLFEHLMFDGSRNVARGGYDLHCTSVGGENNAFTNCDITNYYITLPSDQLPLGLWLESDRMAGFGIQEISLETQKNVVLEEKRQTMDDVPYGDVSQVLAELSFAEEHPYSWDTIGFADDIRSFTMEDVRDLYERFYTPSNATLVVAGDFEPDIARQLIDTYFASIPSGPPVTHPDNGESLRRFGNTRRVESSLIPFDAVFLAYHLPPIRDREILALELLAAVLSDGESSRLYQALEYHQEISSETECFIEEGELGSVLHLYAIAQNEAITPAQLQASLMAELDRLVTDGVSERELQKVKNRKMTAIVRSLQSISSRAERLAFFATLFGDPALAFHEAELYDSITVEDVLRVGQRWLAGQSPNVAEYVRAIP